MMENGFVFQDVASLKSELAALKNNLGEIYESNILLESRYCKSFCVRLCNYFDLMN